MSLKDCSRALARARIPAASDVSELAGWKLATCAFIVGLRVTAGVATSAFDKNALGNIQAAAELVTEAVGPVERCEEVGGGMMSADCAGTAGSEGPIPTFLIADLLAIFPGLADDPLASDEAEAPVGPDRVGAARGTVFSSVAVAEAALGVGFVT